MTIDRDRAIIETTEIGVAIRLLNGVLGTMPVGERKDELTSLVNELIDFRNTMMREEGIA